MPNYRYLLVAALAAGAGAAAVAVAADAPVEDDHAFARLRLGEIKAEPTKTGARREIFDAPTATLERFASHITTLNPGEAPHAAHRHPEEELMIVKEGTLEVMLEGKPTRAEAGGMIFCASNELHGIRNVGKTPATYYVVKWYAHGMPKTAAATPAPAPTK